VPPLNEYATQISGMKLCHDIYCVIACARSPLPINYIYPLLTVFYLCIGLEWNQVHNVGQLIGLMHHTLMINDDEDCGAVGGMMDWQVEPKEQTCFSGALSTTDSIRYAPVSNPGRRGGKPATLYQWYSLCLLSLFSSVSLVYLWYIVELTN
jgi:hypothetical protein